MKMIPIHIFILCCHVIAYCHGTETGKLLLFIFCEMCRLCSKIFRESNEGKMYEKWHYEWVKSRTKCQLRLKLMFSEFKGIYIQGGALWP